MSILTKQISEEIINSIILAQSDGLLPDFDLPDHIHLSNPKQIEWGDYSSAFPLQMSKQLSLSPISIAESIQKKLISNTMFENVTVSKPGFLNVTLSVDWLCASVEAVLEKGSSFADLQEFEGKEAQVEFVSANPTGPLTVGHGRGGVIGDTLSNLLSSVGYKVTREYYYNNAGRQMKILGESLRIRYLQSLGRDLSLSEHHYQGDYLVDLSTQLVDNYGDSLVESHWKEFTKIAEENIASQQHNTLSNLNIVMDILYNEQSLYEDGSVDNVIEILKSKGLAYEKDGALWFALTILGGSEDRVIVKSSGDPTYRLPDISYHCNKLERGFDLVVDVLGADHKDSFPDVLLGVQAMGYDSTKIKLLMHQFVNIKGQRMSKRSGNYITLDNLIEEVGADVVRFFMLMRTSESHLDFDVDLAREQSEKNPVYYVQYAHARICSILDRAESIVANDSDKVIINLTHESERVLMRKLLELSDTIDRSVRELSPHYLTNYARDLASSFHAFYGACKVLDVENIQLSKSRINLVKAVQIGLLRALELLGVTAPESM